MTPTKLGSSPHLLDVLIIGGGLSGLLIANQLPPGISWRLLEAQPALGGRLANGADLPIDMGGAWIWPSHQPRMKSLVHEFGIDTFEQQDDPSSTRFVNGASVQLIERLSKDLMKNIILSSPVQKCTMTKTGDGEDDSIVQVETEKNEVFQARRVVVAVPPKLVEKNIKFNPPLEATKADAMKASHTWMAGVTKVALVYPRRFWARDMSNSGLPTQLGPAFQVYDSSTNDDSVAALTFFALVDPSNKQALSDDQMLAQQVAKQISQFWAFHGQADPARQVLSYSQVLVKRWPNEKYISEDPEPSVIHPHPSPVPALAEPAWEGHLEFASSETDQDSPGVMEGAVGAAQRVLTNLKIAFSKRCE